MFVLADVAPTLVTVPVFVDTDAGRSASVRSRNVGAAAAPDDSGYQRVLLSPGIEVHLHPVKIYADVELPVYQNMNGNQLVAPALFKLSISYMF